jgi:hypothetical protein
MNLYLISQDVNEDYDTYDSAVVVAKNAHEARHMHPGGYKLDTPTTDLNDGTWAQPKDVRVKLIGTTKDKIPGVICASFNAG